MYFVNIYCDRIYTCFTLKTSSRKPFQLDRRTCLLKKYNRVWANANSWAEMSPVATRALKDNRSQLKHPGRKEYRRLHFRHGNRRAAVLFSLKEVRPGLVLPSQLHRSVLTSSKEGVVAVNRVMLMTPIAEISPMEPQRKMELDAKFFFRSLFVFSLYDFLTQKSAYPIEVTVSQNNLC